MSKSDLLPILGSHCGRDEVCRSLPYALALEVGFCVWGNWHKMSESDRSHVKLGGIER